MEFSNELQPKIKELEEENSKLTASISEKDERIHQLETKYNRDMKLVQKKLSARSTP